MNRVIKFNDGFIFRDVTDIAEKMYGVDDLFAVDVNQETESLITHETEINYHIKYGRRICTEVGHLKDTIK